MGNHDVDSTDRRRFLKAVGVAGSSLAGTAVASSLAAEAGAQVKRDEAEIAETCTAMEAPLSRSVYLEPIKQLQFSPDQPLPGLPGTDALTWTGDLSVKMMDGAHRYVERKISESATTRQEHWSRDFSSRPSYEKSVEPNRRRFMHKIGVVDDRLPAAMERFGDDFALGLVAETSTYGVYQVRWPVLENVLGLGLVHGEGLLLQPKQSPVGHVVALPDADQTPEQLAGLAPGVEEGAQFARRLAEQGCLVVMPTLIDRSTQWSGHPEFRMTDQTHREWIYRQAFHMGRHIIGYEVQKVLAAVDWFWSEDQHLPIGAAGYGEGGLIAFYSAAVDTRINAALVSGYFNSRQRVWCEPIYRNVWGLLEEFGDAELATLLAPRGLVVEFTKSPEAMSSEGDLTTPSYLDVMAEFERIDALLKPGFQPRQLISGSGNQPVGPGSPAALRAFLELLGIATPVRRPGPLPLERRTTFSHAARQKRQVRELEGHVQSLVRNSTHALEKFFLHKVEPGFANRDWTTKLRFDQRSPEAFIAGARWYRDHLWKEVLGKFEKPYLPPNPRSRKIYDTERWVGYEVILNVWEDVFAWGILLVPKDIKPVERRPVVVCQHGRGSWATWGHARGRRQRR